MSAGGSWDAMIGHELQLAVNLAAIQLAAAIDVQDRIDSDPEYAADRSYWAEQRRAESRRQLLQQYRDAVAARDQISGRSADELNS